jgi:hypothetical protein
MSALGFITTWMIADLFTNFPVHKLPASSQRQSFDTTKEKNAGEREG